MRRNIDAWWPAVEAGAEAILSSATGCGSLLADYGEMLADDPDYADKARHISALCRDAAQVLVEEDLQALEEELQRAAQQAEEQASEGEQELDQAMAEAERREV